MKLLVISHDASRSGAPILLLNLLKAFKEKHPSVIIDIIIRRNGPLVEEFAHVANSVLILNNNKKYPSSALNKLVRKSLYKVVAKFNKVKLTELAVKKFVAKDYDLVFSNTISNGGILHSIQPINCHVLTYVHELENVIRSCTSKTTLAFNIKYTNSFLVPSKVVGDNLSLNHNVPLNKIGLLHYYVPEPDELKFSGINIKEISLNGEVVIGAIGTLEWRKGADLFVQVALQLKKKRGLKGIKFVWVGADQDTNVYQQIKYDLLLAGLSEFVLLIEKVKNPLEYLSLMDIFLMPSREDPYPLVVLEAAMLKKPIICFKDAGGASEFLSEGNGVVVPYVDVEAMTESLLALINDPKQRELYGAKARNNYEQLHSKEQALKEFEAIVESVCLK